jgi:hypothetical protein
LPNVGPAQQNLEFVVRFFPEADSKIYASLALLYRAEGKLRSADDVLGKGRRIFKEDTLLQSLELKR